MTTHYLFLECLLNYITKLVNDVKVMQGILQEYYTLYNEAGKIEETIMMFGLN